MVAILQNIVVCPHCDQAFEHNKINGIALVQLASEIEARKRVHLRLMLNAIERENALDVAKVRKVIFDGVNDLIRDIHTQIGFGVDAE